MSNRYCFNMNTTTVKIRPEGDRLCEIALSGVLKCALIFMWSVVIYMRVTAERENCESFVHT